MRHALARRVVSGILAGDGFGQRAVTHALVASLSDRAECPDDLRRTLDGSADTIGSDSAAPYLGVLNQRPIPRDERDLCAQLAPTLIDHPSDTGLNLASLLSLVEVWPHVASDERPLLRLRFLNGLIARRSPAGSFVTRDTLCAWQRQLQTTAGDTPPTVATLQSLLDEPTAQGAYRRIAEHLGPSVDLKTLNHVLGALAIQVMLRFHDRDGTALQVLLGTVACEQLVAWMPPEHLAILTSQLAHQLWWCRHESSLPPVLVCIDPSSAPMVEAVTSGDVTLAQRAARVEARVSEQFWESAWRLVTASIKRQDDEWPSALRLVSAIAWRTGSQAVSPDDAAALAAVLAAYAHHRSASATTPR
ncbi:MAG: hypothetical protein H0V44_15190 [Planctomycetes bacterium]|nr:hypothetical protein [Planctomycetota bacterium]